MSGPPSTQKSHNTALFWLLKLVYALDYWRHEWPSEEGKIDFCSAQNV
jgi:hypothetical protein